MVSNKKKNKGSKKPRKLQEREQDNMGNRSKRESSPDEEWIQAYNNRDEDNASEQSEREELEY